MGRFIPWNSQPLEVWAQKHAEGYFIELHGRKTHYLEQGQGAPVILVHGFNMDSATWTANIEPLAAHFHVFAPDLWGKGFSTRQPLDYGYALYAEQIHLLMNALDLRRASLVGHSMGAGIIARFALKHPGKVDRLVLVDSAGIPTTLPQRSKFFQLPLIPEVLLALPIDLIRRKNLADLWIHNKSLLTDQVYTKFSCFQKVAGTTEALLSMLRKEFFHTLHDDFRALGQLDLPTLIIWGREDAAIPLSSGKEIHRLLPGSKMEILDGAGHLSNFELPELFNSLVIDFLMAP